MKIGLLEWGFRENVDSLTAIQQILDYACRADELGFSRFWLTEHHNPNKLAPFTNPDILITLIAGMTNEIKVGAAGILIKMHESYSIATNYKLLSNLYPGRIDLGLAKGDPGSEYLRLSLYDASDKSLVNNKIAEIYNYLNNELSNFERNSLIIPPFAGAIPKLWCLTRSYSDTEIAIKCQMNICRTIMHGRSASVIAPQKEVLYAFKKKFQEVNQFSPEISLALAVVIDDDLSLARRKVDELDIENPDNMSIQPIAVSPESLIELLFDLQDRYGIDEFILYDLEGENSKKMENLKKISSAMYTEQKISLNLKFHQC